MPHWGQKGSSVSDMLDKKERVMDGMTDKKRGRNTTCPTLFSSVTDLLSVLHHQKNRKKVDSCNEWLVYQVSIFFINWITGCSVTAFQQFANDSAIMFLGKSITGVEISAILPLFICRYTMCCTIIQDKIEVLLQTVYNIVKKNN